MSRLALAAAILALASGSAAAADAAFSLVSLDGPASIDGKAVRAGQRLRAGRRLRVEGGAVLRGAGYRLRVRGPAIIEAAADGISLASGTVLAVRLAAGRRLHVQTPAAGLDLGHEAFFVEPRGGQTYLCVCSPESEGGVRAPPHSAALWSDKGLSGAPGPQGHGDRDLAQLRKPAGRR